MSQNQHCWGFVALATNDIVLWTNVVPAIRAHRGHPDEPERQPRRETIRRQIVSEPPIILVIQGNYGVVVSRNEFLLQMTLNVMTQVMLEQVCIFRKNALPVSTKKVETPSRLLGFTCKACLLPDTRSQNN